MGGRVQIGGVWCGWEGADRRGVGGRVQIGRVWCG